MYRHGLSTACFIFTIICMTGCSNAPKVTFIQGENTIDIRIDGNSVAEYRYSPDLVKPVLYPVRTPGGIVMTRHFPFEEVDDESHDHPHHTGVFFTYDEVNGNRFWASTTPPPQIRHVNITEMLDGKGRGTLSTVSHWIAKDGRILLEEQRTMNVYPGENEYAIDFVIKLTAVDTTVVFGSTKEGMFAIRVAPWLKENGGNGNISVHGVPQPLPISGHAVRNGYGSKVIKTVSAPESRL